MTATTPPPTGAGARSAALLAAFADRATLTVGELSAATGIPTSAVYRLLPVLTDAGLVTPSRTRGRYCAGSLSVRLAANYKRHMFSQGAISKRLHSLAAETSELAAFLIPTGSRILCVESADGPHVIRCAFSAGSSQPLTWGASANAILAYLPSSRVDRAVIDHGLSDADASRLRRDLERVRERGYSISVGALDEGVWGVSVPVLAASGEVTGTVSTMAPGFRVHHQQSSLISLTHAAADDIARMEVAHS